VQIPIYPEVPFLLYFIIGWILVIIVGLTAFIVLFLKRDMREFSHRFGKIESDMSRVKHPITNIACWIKKVESHPPQSNGTLINAVEEVSHKFRRWWCLLLPMYMADLLSK
jgi:hypothetical protein